MPEIEGSVRDLYRLRQAYRTTQKAISDLEGAGLDSSPLIPTYDELAGTELIIPVPCILCRRKFPLSGFRVADDALPVCIVCEECDERVTNEVLEASQPKRKRRTKAEMEAARALAETDQEENTDPT